MGLALVFLASAAIDFLRITLAIGVTPSLGSPFCLFSELIADLSELYILFSKQSRNDRIFLHAEHEGDERSANRE